MGKFIETLNNVTAKADRQVSRNGFRTLHRNYMHDYIGQADYYEQLLELVNTARRRIGIRAYTPSEFEHACQYRSPGSESWSEARNEILNLIVGWY